eukprot:607246-Prymnesium_polylepis.1
MSLVWSIGGTCTKDGRIKFDSWLRDALRKGGTKADLPTTGLVYDFVFDFESSKWTPWLRTVPDYVVDPKINFQQDYSAII